MFLEVLSVCLALAAAQTVLAGLGYSVVYAARYWPANEDSSSTSISEAIAHCALVLACTAACAPLLLVLKTIADSLMWGVVAAGVVVGHCLHARRNSQKAIGRVLVYFFTSFFVLVATHGYWHQPETLHDGIAEVHNVYWDYYPHLQLQQHLAFHHEGGPVLAPGGYPAALTKNSNVVSTFSSLPVALATLGDPRNWTFSLAMAASTWGVQLMLLAVLAILRGTLGRAWCVVGVAMLLVGYLGEITVPTHWLYTHFVGGNSGVSIALFLSVVWFCSPSPFASSVPEKRARLLLLAAPCLLWSRLTWVPFYGPFLLFLFFTLIRSQVAMGDKVRDVLRRVVPNVVVAAGLALLVVTNNDIFGRSPGKLELETTPSLDHYLHYLSWSPRYRAFAIEFARGNLLRGMASEVFLNAATALAIGYIGRSKTLGWIGFAALFFQSAAMFLVKPLGEAFKYGSGEPLVSFMMLRERLLPLLAVLLLPWNRFSLGWLERFSSRHGWTRHALLTPGVVVLCSLSWFGSDSFKYSPAFVVQSQAITQLRAACHRGEVRGVYWTGRVRGPSGRYAKGHLQRSLMAAYTGCLNVGEERYSHKLSSTDARLEFQKLGDQVIRDCGRESRAGARIDSAKRALRGARIAVARLDGRCAWW